MCKVRSSTLLHSTIFFCQVFFVFCVGAAAQKTTTLLTTTINIFILIFCERGASAFFFPCCCYEFFFFEVSFSIVQYYNTTTTSYGGTYYYYFHPSILSKYTLVFTLLYLSRVVLFDVPVAQKRRHSERKVGWIFFYVKLEIFLQTFRLFLPGRVVFLQRNRTLRLVVVKQ